MTTDRTHELMVRTWAHPTVRRLAASRAGLWFSSRRRVRALLDTFHERRRDHDAHPLRSSAHQPPPVARPNTAATPSTPAPVVRFLVLAQGRSGSTLLIHSLGRRWSEISSRGEEFSRENPAWSSFEDSLQRTFLVPSEHPIIGCKVLLGQTTTDELIRLLELDDMHVIVLRRHGLLRRHVSEQIARSTNQWFRHSTEPASTASSRAVTIDTGRLHRQLLLSRRFFEDLDLMTQDLPRMELWYEDLDNDLDGQLRRVAEFLGAGAPSNDAPPSLLRQNPEPLRELVTNLDEVHAFLRANGFSELIAEDESNAAAIANSTAVSTPATLNTPTSLQILALRSAFGTEETSIVGPGPDPSIDPFLAALESMDTDPQTRRLATAIRRRLRNRGSSSALLDRLHRDSTVLNLRLVDMLPTVVSVLEDIGIPSIPVGGTAIAASASTTGSGHPMDRLELAIQPGDEIRATESVVADGWRRSIDGLFTRGDLTLVLHRYERGPFPDQRLVVNTRAGAELSTEPSAIQLMNTLLAIVEGPLPDRFRRVIDALFLMQADAQLIDPTRMNELAQTPHQRKCISDARATIDHLLEPYDPAEPRGTERAHR